jgi:4-hydroxy-2-oxoheptanedioate aldolase
MPHADPIFAFAEKVRSGPCQFCAWIGFAEPAIAEQMAADGFDAVMLDMQHGALDLSAAHRGIAHAGLAGKPAIARIPVGDFATASRLLDMGAVAIIAPMINSQADAQVFADFTKFPPLGARSWGPRRVLALTGMDTDTYLREANRQHLSIAMIETKEAMAALDDILEVAGIDGVFVGPSDLSIALSDGRSVNPGHPEVDAALDEVCRKAKAHGKFAAAFCFDGARAKALRLRGYSLCSVSTDSLLLRQATKAELAVARS